MENSPPPPPPPSLPPHPPPNAAGGGRGTAAQNSLRALNKSSHKISKAAHARPQNQGPAAAPARPEAPAEQPEPPPPPPQPQPPVYNINKNDFRDVVQKLTGSPAHHGATPPAKPAPPAASRLQRNRPPPLSQLGPAVADGGGAASARPWMSTPLSPLPPLPTVSAAAESPITAYMRCLRGGGGGPAAPAAPAGAPLFPLPTSPLAFGCLPSPQSGFPSSPRVPVPSPKWEQP